IFSCYELSKVRPQPHSLQDRLELPPQCSGHHSQLETLQGGVLDEISHAGHQAHASADGLLIEGMLSCHRFANRAIIVRTAHSLEGKPEAFAVIQSEIFLVVRLTTERKTILGQRCGQSVAMLVFVVDNDTVEIEEDTGGH